MFADADSFEPYAEFSPEDAAALMTEGGYEDQIMDVQTAKDASGNVLGYVISVTAKDASQAPITFSVGIRNNDAGDGYLINGYSITSIAETPGLGMKATEEKFAGQFENSKVTDYYQVVKSAPSAANEIESISGSTITSAAMANGVNACIYYYENILSGGAEG